MDTSRGAFFLGLSLIVCVAMFIYGPQMGNLRYLTVPTNQGIFILDTKTQMVNLCTAKSCRVVPANEAVITQNNSPIYGYGPTYGQMGPQAPMVNSLGVVENQNAGILPNCVGCNVGGYIQRQALQPMQAVQPVQQPQVMQRQQPQMVANTNRVENVENELGQLRNEESALGL